MNSFSFSFSFDVFVNSSAKSWTNPFSLDIPRMGSSSSSNSSISSKSIMAAWFPSNPPNVNAASTIKRYHTRIFPKSLFILHPRPLDCIDPTIDSSPFTNLGIIILIYWCCIMAVCYDMSVVCCVLCLVCCVLCAPRGLYVQWVMSVVSGQWSVGAFGAFEEYFEKKKQNETERFHYELQLRLLLRHLFCLRYLFLCAPKQLAYYYKSNLKFRTFEISNYGIPHFDQQRTTTLFDYNLQYIIQYLYLPNTHPLHRIILAYCLRGKSLLIVVSTVRIIFETVPRSIARATVQQHEHE